MVKRIVLGLLLLGFVIVGVIGLRFLNFLSSKPGTTHEERIVEVPKGASVAAIARRLHEDGVITDPDYFRYYVRIKRAAGQLKAGEFRFYTDQTPPEVLTALVEGRQVTYRLTFPEGRSIKDMQLIVATLPFLDGKRFFDLAFAEDAAKSRGIDAPNLEGFLFPATYELTRTQTEKDLIDMMVRQFKAAWKPEYDARAKELRMTQLEVITLASIVEKETGHPKERPEVSSVFHNRLKIGMKLETDPTIIYGLKDYDGDIKYRDIRNPHPWNTYVHKGLPPTPIANPGAASIHAALYPADTPYLFFVAQDDHTHSFSRTMEEHRQKVRQYQMKRKPL